MNLANATGFLVLAVVMQVLPLIAPSSAASVSLGSASTRYLWLMFMSYVIGGIGLSFMARELGRQLPAAVAGVYARVAARTALVRKPVQGGVPAAAVRATP